MSAGHNYEVWQDGFAVAKTWAETDADARAEAMHYAMVYCHDGMAEVYRRDGRKRQLIATVYPVESLK